ncbi:MAG: nuclear transport factor 2 family protein [Sphingobium sp.]
MSSSDQAQSHVASASSGLKDPAAVLDRFAISEVLMRERLARETHDFDEEDACFFPDATIEVSWFKGRAADFVDAGRKASAAGRQAAAVYFDSMSPPVVRVNGDRGIADASCAIHSFVPLDGVEASMTSFTRLLWRLRRSEGEWRIAAMRGVYIRDQLQSCNPVQIPPVDEGKLDGFRRSYRHLSYVLEASGRPLRDDLPGVDRPETVAALRAADREWLLQGDA